MEYILIIVFFSIVLFYADTTLEMKSILASTGIVNLFLSEKLDILLLRFGLEAIYLKIANVIIYIILAYLIHLVLIKILRLFPSKK